MVNIKYYTTLFLQAKKEEYIEKNKKELTMLSAQDMLGVNTPTTTFPWPCLHTHRKIATLFIAFIALAMAEDATMALLLPGSGIKIQTSFR